MLHNFNEVKFKHTIGSFAHEAKGNDGKCAKKIAKLEVEFYTFLALI